MWDLSENFETTYVSLIKAIRGLAYPKHPSIVQSEILGNPGIVPSTAPASIPIFIMRPLRGQLEQATQNAVSKVRADGDKAVFWLDTSGWLDPNVEDTDMADFFLDETVTPARWRLTEQGNQRTATSCTRTCADIWLERKRSALSSRMKYIKAKGWIKRKPGLISTLKTRRSGN